MFIDFVAMRLSLRQLEIFAAIARCGSVSRAAGALSMSQSAASSALVELERQFDCALFDRIGKSLHLNSTGEGLLPMAESLLQQAQEIEGYLAGRQLGPLHLGATLTIGNYLATLLVADYMQRNNDAPVALHVANTESVLQGLLNFASDLALVEGEALHPDLLAETWLSDELVVFCAPHYPRPPSQAQDSEWLARQPWILRERGSGTRGQFDRVIGKAMGQVMLRLELEHTEAIKRAVESGLGIGCLSRLSLREAFRRGSLVEIPTPQFDLRRNFYIVRHRQRHESAAMRSFTALCREIGQQASDTGALVLPFIP